MFSGYIFGCYSFWKLVIPYPFLKYYPYLPYVAILKVFHNLLIINIFISILILAKIAFSHENIDFRKRKLATIVSAIFLSNFWIQLLEGKGGVCYFWVWLVFKYDMYIPPELPSSICFRIFLPVAVKERKFSLSVSISNCRSWNKKKTKIRTQGHQCFPWRP